MYFLMFPKQFCHAVKFENHWFSHLDLYNNLLESEGPLKGDGA